jgi:glycine betaine/proline transport system substrate-binding protein
MTSKHIKRFLSTIAIVSMSVSTVQADNIKIAELNWQSGSMIANIDAYILSNGYGHYTELVPGGIDATIQSMMATGSPNIFGEAWTSLLGDSALVYINNGTLIQVRDEVVVGAGESWYIPNYIQEQYGLNTIEDVLARPDLFPHPEDSSKGGIVICPEGWSCKKHNENLFRAFDMEAKGWKIIDPGSGTGLNAFWEGQVVKEKGAFGYYWAPTY